MDVHIQFLGVHGIDGDSASVTIATAIMSDLENIPVRQDLAMTGSLSVRGKVLPVGGITAKIEGAYQVGIKEVIVPAANMEDIVLDEKIRNAVRIIPVETLDEVFSVALIGWDKKKRVSEFSSPPQPKGVTPSTKTVTFSG